MRKVRLLVMCNKSQVALDHPVSVGGMVSPAELTYHVLYGIQR